jgi:plastocyanin
MRRLLPLALIAMAIAGCGSNEPSSKPKPTAAATATAMTTSKPSAPAAVEVKNFDYAPATLKVKAGTRVTWRNDDATNHTVTFSGGGAPRDIDNLAERARATRTFTRAGTFAYVCGFHPNMHGRVVVSG